jgi:hypothetical protein
MTIDLRVNETMVEPVENDHGINGYWSPENVNMQYAVTLRENTGNGKTCFGFIPHSYLETVDEIRDPETYPYTDIKE